jgi:uncharacterized protein DUF6883
MAEGSRSIHPNALANYENCVILRSKLEGFALDPMHDYGKHHARVFKSTLGFEQLNWEILEQRIREELPYCEAVAKDVDHHGKRYQVIMEITGPNGSTASVLTAWIIKVGTDYPVLTSAYVSVK